MMPAGLKPAKPVKWNQSINDRRASEAIRLYAVYNLFTPL